MFKSIFLVEQGEGHSTFSSHNLYETVSHVIKPEMRKRALYDIVVNRKSLMAPYIDINNGDVLLKLNNFVYNISYIAELADIVMPPNPQPMDYVVLFLDQTNIIEDVKFGQRYKLKIYGNKKRIMGYDEPLVCDIPFMSLRFTFVDDMRGWVIN